MSFFIKNSSNTKNLSLDILNINETTKYNMVDLLPNQPENGMIVYNNNDLKIYNNNQWETIANTSNETFNNLIVNGNLTVDTNVLKVDSSENRVGINNSNPSYSLDLKSTDNILSSFRRTTDVSDAVIEIGRNTLEQSAYIGYESDKVVFGKRNTTQIITYDNSGNTKIIGNTVDISANNITQNGIARSLLPYKQFYMLCKLDVSGVVIKTYSKTILQASTGIDLFSITKFGRVTLDFGFPVPRLWSTLYTCQAQVLTAPTILATSNLYRIMLAYNDRTNLFNGEGLVDFEMYNYDGIMRVSGDDLQDVGEYIFSFLFWAS